MLAVGVALAGCATVRSGGLKVAALTPGTADNVLRPGDFLFRYVNPTDPLSDAISGAIIRGSQAAIEATGRALKLGGDEVKQLLHLSDVHFDQALTQADPNAVHVAVYLGNGETAEAFGTTASDAAVNTWSLFAEYRKGSAWRVFRHDDPRIAEQVAAIARRWATGRMAYKLPFEVFVRDASWGPHARESARGYVKALAEKGGPPTESAMFCSQFAVAVFQASATKVLLATDSPTDAQLDQLPPEARLDAVVSPLRVYGEWLASGHFRLVGHIVIDEP